MPSSGTAARASCPPVDRSLLAAAKYTSPRRSVRGSDGAREAAEGFDGGSEGVCSMAAPSRAMTRHDLRGPPPSVLLVGWGCDSVVAPHSDPDETTPCGAEAGSA